MTKALSVVSSRKKFIEALNSNLDLFEQILPHATYSYHANKSAIHPSQATRVIGLCFMSNIGAWEEFLGRVFIRYMAGARSPSYAPVLKIGSCNSMDHAIDVLAGKSDYDITTGYLTWTKFADVCSKATIFFERGEPFTKIPPVYKDRIADAIVIRNRVAHSSEKCIKDFAKVAKRYLSLAPTASLPQGTSVGKLLKETDVKHFQTFNSGANYYEAYDQMFRHLAYMLVPD